MITSDKMPIYLPNWIEVVVMLHNMPDRERYYQKLYRRLKMNSGHARTMIHHLERCCLIERVPEKKIRYITLTERGQMLAKLAMRMKFLLKDSFHLQHMNQQETSRLKSQKKQIISYQLF